MKSTLPVHMALSAAIQQAAAKPNGNGHFSRKSPLTLEALIRLLIGAEGGCLAKILHDAGIQVTASAVSQRRAQIDPSVLRAVFDSFNSNCVDEHWLCLPGSGLKKRGAGLERPASPCHIFF